MTHEPCGQRSTRLDTSRHVSTRLDTSRVLTAAGCRPLQTWSRQMAEKLINPPRRAQPYKSPPPSASPEAPRGSAAPPLPPRSPPARTAPPEPARRAPEPPPAATHDATKWLGTVFARPEDSDEATRVVSTRSPVPVEVRSDVSSKQGASLGPPPQTLLSCMPWTRNSVAFHSLTSCAGRQT